MSCFQSKIGSQHFKFQKLQRMECFNGRFQYFTMQNIQFVALKTDANITRAGPQHLPPKLKLHPSQTNFDKLENLVYHFFKQLWLVLGVKLMEMNSNWFSRETFLVGKSPSHPSRLFGGKKTLRLSSCSTFFG